MNLYISKMAEKTYKDIKKISSNRTIMLKAFKHLLVKNFKNYQLKSVTKYTLSSKFSSFSQQWFICQGFYFSNNF